MSDELASGSWVNQTGSSLTTHGLRSRPAVRSASYVPDRRNASPFVHLCLSFDPSQRLRTAETAAGAFAAGPNPDGGSPRRIGIVPYRMYTGSRSACHRFAASGSAMARSEG
jgi:hypothetical protein